MFLQESKFQECYISHFHSLEKFFIRIIHEDDTLRSLNKQLNNTVDLYPFVIPPMIGLLNYYQKCVLFLIIHFCLILTKHLIIMSQNTQFLFSFVITNKPSNTINTPSTTTNKPSTTTNTHSITTNTNTFYTTTNTPPPQTHTPPPQTYPTPPPAQTHTPPPPPQTQIPSTPPQIHHHQHTLHHHKHTLHHHKTLYHHHKHILHPHHTGDLCITVDSNFNTYRSRILKIESSPASILILHIDYGSSNWYEPTKIFQADPNKGFSSLIHRVYPGLSII